MQRVEDLQATITTLDGEKQRKEKDVLTLKEKYATQKAETARHFRKCERLSSEVLTMKETQEKRQQSYNEKDKELMDLKNKKEEMISQINSMQATLTSLSQDNATLKAKYDEAEQLLFLFKEKEHDLYALKEQMAIEQKKVIKDLKAKDVDLAVALKRVAGVGKGQGPPPSTEAGE